MNFVKCYVSTNKMTIHVTLNGKILIYYKYKYVKLKKLINCYFFKKKKKERKEVVGKNK
jgi:hypothetical protein